MYRLLIVGDSNITEEMLTQLMQWNKFSFDFLFDYDKRKVKKVLEQYRVNLVIVDVKEEEDFAYKLIQWCYKNGIQVRFLLLCSGIKEYFKEVYKKCEEINYIEGENISVEKIDQEIKRVKLALDSQIRMQKEIMNVYYKEDESEDFTQFTEERLVAKNKSALSCRDMAQRVSCCIVKLEEDLLTKEVDRIEVSIKKIFKSDDKICISRIGPYELLLIAFNSTYFHYRYDAKSLVNKMDTELVSIDNRIESICFGMVPDLSRGLHTVFQTLFHLSNQKKAVGSSKIIFCEDSKAIEASNYKLGNEMLMMLQDFNLNGDIDIIIAEIAKLKKRYELIPYIRYETIFYAVVTCFVYSKKYYEKRTNIQAIEEEDWNYICEKLATIKTTANFFETLESLIEYNKSSCSKISSNYIVRTAQQYINAHFKEKISVMEIAKEIGVSYTYLSKLFRQVNGITIKDSIINLQMNEAKRLLMQSNIQVGEISRIIGYENEHYFSRIFKLKEGVTPTQFRNGIGKIS